VQEPKKKTLWQKITSIFGGSPQKAERPAPVRSSNGSGPAAGRPPRDSAKPAESRAPKPVRKPENIEVTSPRVYVGNLSFDATESDLMELFSGVGLVQNAEIVTNKHTQRSKGFGFVQMQTTEEAKRAVEVLHDKDYMGRKLVVSGAKAVDERRSERTPVQPEQ
jgi:RNA recognition motif-containing protein